MRTTFNTNNNLTMISEMINEATFQVFEYDNLKGVIDGRISNKVKYLNALDIKLKQVRVVLDDSSIKIREDALSFIKGSISRVNIKKNNSLGNKFFKSRNSDDLYTNEILQGSGEVFLKPSLGYFYLIELENEEIIMNEEIFYACEDTIEVTSYMQKRASTIKNDSKGIESLKLKGEGIVVVELPVPENEIIRCKIYKDRLAVNGDGVILTTNNVQLTIEKYGQKAYDEYEEELINIYSGVGQIWLLPTIDLYNNMNGTNSDEENYEEYEYEED